MKSQHADLTISKSIERFEASSSAANVVLRRIQSTHWQLPTPCSEWDVRNLVHHLVYEDVWAPPLLQGQTIAEVGDRFEGELLGDDPLAAWDGARAGVLAEASRTPADRVVHLSFGECGAADYLDQLSVDHLIHGWDVATAIGVPYQPDSELLEWAFGQLAPQEEMLKASGAFGAKVVAPDGASVLTRLLAVSGRRA